MQFAKLSYFFKYSKFSAKKIKIQSVYTKKCIVCVNFLYVQTILSAYFRVYVVLFFFITVR